MVLREVETSWQDRDDLSAKKARHTDPPTSGSGSQDLMRLRGEIVTCDDEYLVIPIAA
jgi:hypothetical protein